MTLWYILLILLGIVSCFLVYFAYHAIVFRFVLSLFQRFVLYFVFLILSFFALLIWILVGISASNNTLSHFISPSKGELQGFALMGGIVLTFALFASIGNWIFDIIALKRGARFKRLARQAKDAGDNEEADRYEKKYLKAIFRIRIFGRAKEVEELENPTVSPRAT